MDVVPIHILLIEDNPADARLTEESFAESRLRNVLSWVQDGEEALDFLYRRGRHAGAGRPDLVLLDLNLPKRDGREVLAAIKGDPGLRRIPVVVVTTSDAEQDVARSYDLHANCYITKPADLDRFLHVVRAIEGFWLSTAKLP